MATVQDKIFGKAERETNAMMPNARRGYELWEMKENVKIWRFLLENAEECKALSPMTKSVLGHRFALVSQAASTKEAQHHYDYARGILARHNITEGDTEK